MSFFCNALAPTLSTRPTSHAYFDTMGGVGRQCRAVLAFNLQVFKPSDVLES